MKFKVFLFLFVLSCQLEAASYTGRLEWLYTIPMHAIASAEVTEVAVDKYQKVKKGDLLIRTRQDVLKARLELAEAKVKKTRLGAEDARRGFDRVQELFDRGLTSLDELKKAELTDVTSQQALAEAKAALAAVNERLEHSEFSASEDAIVLELNVRPGQMVFRSTRPIIEIAPYKKMLVRVLVGSNELKRYKIGQKARLIIPGSTSRVAKIYRIGFVPVRIESKGAVYEIDLIFDVAANESLRPSEVVRVVLP